MENTIASANAGDTAFANLLMMHFLFSFITKTSSRRSETFFTTKIADGFQRIDIADVDYLEAQNKQVPVHLSDNRTITIRELFSKTEITAIHHAVIPISRNNYAAFKEIYFSHMFEMAETS